MKLKNVVEENKIIETIFTVKFVLKKKWCPTGIRKPDKQVNWILELVNNNLGEIW